MFGNHMSTIALKGAGGMFKTPNPSIGFSNLGENIGTMLSNSSQKDVKMKDIEWAISRFPELSYHLGAISDFVAYAGSTPWANRDALGPAGISLVFSKKDQSGVTAGAVLSGALTKLKESGTDLEALTAFLGQHIRENSDTIQTKTEENEVQFLRAVCKELVDTNGTLMKVYKMAFSLLTYSMVVQDFNEDYSILEIYSPDEIELDKKENTDEIKNWRQTARMMSNDERETVYKVRKTGNPLSPRARALVVNDGDLKKSVVGKVIHYLRILDLIETSMSVERVTKSLSFLVWKVGVDGMPGEQVTDYLAAYRGIVMNRLKAGMKDGDLVSSEITRSLSATHIFVPNFKDSPTTVEPMKLEFKPLMEDINYWWQKTYMAMGIPPYYNDVSKLQGSSGGITDFHENVFGANVRFYQSICEIGLKEWIVNFLTTNINSNLTGKYNLALHLPIFVSAGEESRGEYMRRINQFASAFSTLSVAGMPIKPSFAVKLLFPNTDESEVIDWKVRALSMGNANEQTGGQNTNAEDAYDPKVVDSLISGMVSGQSQNLESDEQIPVNELITQNFNADDNE